MEANQVFEAVLITMDELDCNFELAASIVDEAERPVKLWDNGESGPEKMRLWKIGSQLCFEDWGGVTWRRNSPRAFDFIMDSLFTGTFTCQQKQTQQKRSSMIKTQTNRLQEWSAQSSPKEDPLTEN